MATLIVYMYIHVTVNSPDINIHIYIYVCMCVCTYIFYVHTHMFLPSVHICVRICQTGYMHACIPTYLPTELLDQLLACLPAYPLHTCMQASVYMYQVSVNIDLCICHGASRTHMQHTDRRALRASSEASGGLRAQNVDTKVLGCTFLPKPYNIVGYDPLIIGYTKMVGYWMPTQALGRPLPISCVGSGQCHAFPEP